MVAVNTAVSERGPPLGNWKSDGDAAGDQDRAARGRCRLQIERFRSRLTGYERGRDRDAA
jgi:hypothetical protein